MMGELQCCGLISIHKKASLPQRREKKLEETGHCLSLVMIAFLNMLIIISLLFFSLEREVSTVFLTVRNLAECQKDSITLALSLS